MTSIGSKVVVAVSNAARNIGWVKLKHLRIFFHLDWSARFALFVLSLPLFVLELLLLETTARLSMGVVGVVVEIFIVLCLLFPSLPSNRFE